MKKLFIGVVVICLALGLAACGGTAAAGTPGVAPTGETLSTAYQDALPAGLQLALGTLRLEENGQEIDGATAGALLPLWKAVRSLSASDSTSDLEMQALYRQIEESMAAGQVEAIAEMQLTSSDLAQALSGLEVETGSSESASRTPAVNAIPAGPGGDQPPMGDMAVMGGDATGAQAAVQEGTQTVAAANDGVIPTAVLDAVITMLETKSQS